MLVEQGAGSAAVPGSLAARVRSPVALDALLGRVSTAPDLTTALSRRARLDAGESIITPNGEWLGRNWVRVTRRTDASQGVLAREKELRRTQHSLAELGERINALEAQAGEQTSRLQASESQREQHLESLAQAHRAAAAQEAKLSELHARHPRFTDFLEGPGDIVRMTHKPAEETVTHEALELGHLLIVARGHEHKHPDGNVGGMLAYPLDVAFDLRLRNRRCGRKVDCTAAGRTTHGFDFHAVHDRYDFAHRSGAAGAGNQRGGDDRRRAALRRVVAQARAGRAGDADRPRLRGRHVGAGERLAAADPVNAAMQRDLWMSDWKIAELLERSGNGEARSYWRQTPYSTVAA